jgi:glycosyltransferase involved in cell wall biosynthesis
MKILYSCLSKSWGGMEMVTINSIKQLLNRNYSVELICSADSRIHLEANNLGLIILPVKASGYFHPLTSLKISLLIRRNNYDLIHTQASKDLWLLVPALKLAGSSIPLFLTKQVGSFIIKKDFLHRFIYKRVNVVFAISEVIKNNLLETCPLTEDKIILLPNGVNTQKFDPGKVDKAKVREEFDIGEDKIVLGTLARLTPGKGHEEFLSAAVELNNKYDNLIFLIVGEASRGEEEYAEGIKKMVIELGLKNVIFTGFRSDTPEILSAMDIFIFPSHSEAFGIALVEAMAMGKPSVCTNSDGILDIALNGKTGYLFEKKDPEDLKNKIELLIYSPDNGIAFGKAARERVIEYFDFDKLIDEHVDIYKRIINLISRSKN